jgi:hypothetical protein
MKRIHVFSLRESGHLAVIDFLAQHSSGYTLCFDTVQRPIRIVQQGTNPIEFYLYEDPCGHYAEKTITDKLNSKILLGLDENVILVNINSIYHLAAKRILISQASQSNRIASWDVKIKDWWIELVRYDGGAGANIITTNYTALIQQEQKRIELLEKFGFCAARIHMSEDWYVKAVRPSVLNDGRFTDLLHDAEIRELHRQVFGWYLDTNGAWCGNDEINCSH